MIRNRGSLNGRRKPSRRNDGLSVENFADLMSQGSQRERLLPKTGGHINRAVALNRGLGKREGHDTSRAARIVE